MPAKKPLRKIVRTSQRQAKRFLEAELLWHLRKRYGSGNVKFTLRSMRLNHPSWEWARILMGVSAKLKKRYPKPKKKE